ncbi:MAG: helix-turn-helix transcriptional regulator [Eubacterium sp.]|nr:helix-turn-helix transcriptional regulator [Eubacterium sp.]
MNWTTNNKTQKKLHITQEKLAEHLDVSTAFVSKIER